MTQPESRGGEPNREKQSKVPKAFLSCPTHSAYAAYLEPNSQSMHKTVEGVYVEKIEDKSRIGVFRCQYHDGKATRVYLEPISNRMQKPIGGLLARLKKIESRVAIAEEIAQNHAKKPSRNNLVAL